ncbi:transposase [Halobacteriales archaeon QS_4_66_20]|nr:MAG: transposase [Halobacteriales archaeon QS_4_66_20]
MTQLTEQFHMPDEYHEACDRLTTLVETHTQRLLTDEYWDDTHLDALDTHSGHSYTYIRDDDHDAFEGVEEYLYSRFKRCVYHRVTHVLDAHTDEYDAFRFVTDTVAERKIRRIGWHRLRTRLFDDDDSPYIEWRILESVVAQLNDYYDRHGRFPDSYTDLVDCPDPNGTLPYAPDKGDYHIHDLSVDEGELVVTLNAPDSLSPESHYDWTDHELRFPVHSRFQGMITSGDMEAPTLHASEYGYTLDVPVVVPETECDTVDGRVLAVDLGVKKQVTAVSVEQNGDELTQGGPPQFLDHPAKAKLFRLKADAEGINDRLAELRRQGKTHTDRFDHLLSEFRKTRRKERRLREHIQHDIANELVRSAADSGCERIVFESLGQLDSGETSSAVAWSISSWARGELLDLVAYKAELLGIGVETVNPWGTSRYCPRCGERGRTVNAPDDHTECRHGGHFHCPECGYECDRDMVGALNVGRKHLADTKMEAANPVAYTEAGNHASFPSPSGARSAGVQSTTDQQDAASGRQTHLSQLRVTPLILKRDERESGGLHQNQGRKTGLRRPSGSVTRYVLARTTECS